MAAYDASNSECLVFAFKEGLLSRAAHDLRLRIERFEIRVDDRSNAIDARFDPNSLRLIGAYPNGAPDPEELPPGDVQKIHDHIIDDVLQTQRYPEVRFVSTAVEPRHGVFQVSGELTHHGETRELRLQVRGEGVRWVADIRLHQPDFGIEPFRAVLGTIRIKPDVRVSISVPRSAG